MIINHNISALNTQRQLGANNNNVQGSLEKLSSGLQINKAGDDAAGLAISEKMRGQIRGLDMASKNAQDGVSLIQTAEGALNESQAILQRMRELAVQSSNDSNTETDRGELQKEMDQLAEELSRIGNNTEFNTQNLLGGDFEATFHIGANSDQNIALDIEDMRASELGVVGDAKATINPEEGTLTEATQEGDEAEKNTIVDGEYTVVKEGNNDYRLNDKDGKEVAKSTDGKKFEGSGVDKDSGSGNVGSETQEKLEFANITDGATVNISDGKATIANSVDITSSSLEAGSFKVTGGNGDFELLASNGTVVATSTDGKEFKDADDNVLLEVGSAMAAGDSVKVGGIDISDQSNANKAITQIQSAIDDVSAERSKLGSVQNRLDHTINNLGTSSENLTAAESRIRDVDMAKEMMEFTKNNILTQASQAMLAQANQMPQGVLQLLQ